MTCLSRTNTGKTEKLSSSRSINWVSTKVLHHILDTVLLDVVTYPVVPGNVSKESHGGA